MWIFLVRPFFATQLPIAVVVRRFFMSAPPIQIFQKYRHLQMFLFERSFYERHIYERKAGLSADHLHCPANRHFDARKFSVTYLGQFLCRTDQ